MSKRIGQYLCTWVIRNNKLSKTLSCVSVNVIFSRFTGSLAAAFTAQEVLAKREGWKWQSLCTAGGGGGESSSEKATKRALRILQDVLLIDTSKAVRLVKKYPEFKATSMKKISDTINFLSVRKVGIQRIRNNPWLLLMSPDEIEKNTKAVMSYLKLDFPVAVAFSKLSRPLLVKIAVVWKSKYEIIPSVSKGLYAPQPQNRLEYLACRLECSVEDVADMMAKVTNIATSRIDRLDRVINLLLEADIPTEAMINDPWTFDNQLYRMEERINICREQGCTTIKPWILRASLWKFESYITRTTEQEDVPNDEHQQSAAGFLQDKLGCSESTVKAMLRRVPAIKNRNPVELCKIIDFLYSKGFTSSHVIETPKILGLNVSTISKRLEDLSIIDCVPDSLEVVCQTPKRYNNLIRKITKLGIKATNSDL